MNLTPQEQADNHTHVSDGYLFLTTPPQYRCAICYEYYGAAPNALGLIPEKERWKWIHFATEEQHSTVPAPQVWTMNHKNQPTPSPQAEQVKRRLDYLKKESNISITTYWRKDMANQPSLVNAGDCGRCKARGLLYPAYRKDGTRVGVCWTCREFILELLRRKSK